ncbi:MAG: hypothetical protein LUE20_08495 [Oscillospiraceae bacterium]|nr:hypothetical protein [Oscillospiraceae bacterium]
MKKLIAVAFALMLLVSCGTVKEDSSDGVNDNLSMFADYSENQIYVYNSDTGTSSPMLSDSAYGFTYEDYETLNGKWDMIVWFDVPTVNDNFTSIAYWSNKYAEDGEMCLEPGIWIVDLLSASEFRLDLGELSPTVGYLSWIDNKTLMFETYDSEFYKLNINDNTIDALDLPSDIFVCVSNGYAVYKTDASIVVNNLAENVLTEYEIAEQVSFDNVYEENGIITFSSLTDGSTWTIDMVNGTIDKEESAEHSIETEPTTSQELSDYDEYYESVNSQSLILPEDVEIVEADTDEWFHSFMEYGFTVSDISGNYAYGTYSDVEEEKRYEAVYDITTGEFTELIEIEESNMSYPLEEDYVDVFDITGLDKIVSLSAMYNVERVGNYIAFREGNAMTAYVCEIRDDSVNVIAKGSSVSFGITNNCIFFTNCSELSSSEMKLYVLKIATGEIVAVNFPMPFDETHISNLKSTSEGGIRMRLNEGELSNSLEEYVYYMTPEDIARIATELF